MDIVAPLDGTASGYNFILVIVDYATRYPKAVALQNISAQAMIGNRTRSAGLRCLVDNELVELFSQVGLPREILTDRSV